MGHLEPSIPHRHIDDLLVTHDLYHHFHHQLQLLVRNGHLDDEGVGGCEVLVQEESAYHANDLLGVLVQQTHLHDSLLFILLHPLDLEALPSHLDAHPIAIR